MEKNAKEEVRKQGFSKYRETINPYKIRTCNMCTIAYILPKRTLNKVSHWALQGASTWQCEKWWRNLIESKKDWRRMMWRSDFAKKIWQITRKYWLLFFFIDLKKRRKNRTFTFLYDSGEIEDRNHYYKSIILFE